MGCGWKALPPVTPHRRPGSALPWSPSEPRFSTRTAGCSTNRTHKWSNLWGIPGGKVKWGETSEDALRREVREETNLSVVDVRFVLVQATVFTQPNSIGTSISSC